LALEKRGKVWHYAFMIDGHRYRGSTKEATKSKAQGFEALRIAEVRNSGGNIQLRRAPVLSDFSPRFLKYIEARTAAGQLDEDTEKCYRNGWRLLEPTRVSGMRIDQITTSDAAVLTFPGSPSNGNQALRTLRRMLSYACEVGVLRAAPKIELLEEHGREALIDPWVESLIFEFAPQHVADAIAIMLDCGMRPEELMRMRWEHIHWDRSAILVPYGKSFRSKRFVGMTDRMRTILRAVQVAQDARVKNRVLLGRSEWVFPADSKSGHRLNFNKAFRAVLKDVRGAAKKRGLPELPSGLVPYSARHTFATNFLASGGDLAKLMRLLGHASITTTQKYLHPSIADAAEVMNRHNRNKGLRLVQSA
jgi:integrase